MKKIFGTKNAIAWVSVTAVLAAILITANILLTGLLAGFMDWFFGGDRHVKAGETGNEYYSLDEGITDKESAQAAGNKLTEEICEEGFVLLKNDGILPFTTSEENKMRVSVFGKNSVNLAYGSSGSVGADAKGAKTIFDSLEEADFIYNPALKEFYESARSGPARPASPSMNSGSIVEGFATGETPVSLYQDSEISSFKSYPDAALVVITRVSGENYDLPLTMKNTDGAMEETDHYLELDRNEQDMLKLACDNFENVVLIINSSTPLELGFLDAADDGDPSALPYDFAGKVKGAIWIGMPGAAGIMALGRILNGAVNPSGRTVDLYARDFTSIPAVANFSVRGEANADSYFSDTGAQNQYFIDYEEGVYVGYRYFETRGFTDGEAWYQKSVVYPFGYGLSYTDFTYEVTDTNIKASSDWTTETRDLSVTVKVTNTGSRAGKAVVQLYVTPEYFDGGIEKPHKMLVGFAKTPLLSPAAEADRSAEVTITFDPYDFASYDSENVNGAGVGYVLEAGKYTFRVSTDSHTAVETLETELGRDVLFQADPKTGYAFENRFEDADDQLGSVLSRSDWEGTMPAMRTQEEKKVSQEFLRSLNEKESGNPLKADDRVVTDALKAHPFATVKEDEGMQLWEIIGVEYGTTDKTWEGLWNTLLSRITLSSVWGMLSSGAFRTPAIDYILKPETIDTDGPSGFVKFTGVDDKVFGTVFYASECVLAATWSEDLAHRMGVSIGNEGLIGNTNEGTPYSGWYAPAVNLHRTPFGGRNPEYYSEDSVLSGKLAAKVIGGAAEKGVYAFIKHFAANEQETHRGGVCTWANEQTLRELYLKSFEIAVKDAGATALMTSFNRIGTRWTGGDYDLITEVLRNEWGFKGAVICDFASGQSHMDFKQMVYAGGDLWLDTIQPATWYSADNALDVYMLQESAKHVLYTVANSNAMNGIGEGTLYETRMAYWRIVLIAADVAICTALAVWGAFAIRASVKKSSQPTDPSPSKQGREQSN